VPAFVTTEPPLTVGRTVELRHRSRIWLTDSNNVQAFEFAT